VLPPLTADAAGTDTPSVCPPVDEPLLLEPPELLLDPDDVPLELDPLAEPPEDTAPCTMPTEEPPDVETDSLDDELPVERAPPAELDEVWANAGAAVASTRAAIAIRTVLARIISPCDPSTELSLIHVFPRARALAGQRAGDPTRNLFAQLCTDPGARARHGADVHTGPDP
jgi:hypothetical protein